MIKYIIQRLILMVITLFIIITITFFVIRLMPGGIGENEPGLNPTVREALIKHYGLDKPLSQQYIKYLSNVLHGDFGTSISLRPKKPVFEIILEKLPITIQLNFFANLLIYPFGFGFGILMALKKNTMLDHVFSVLIILFISIPMFVFAALMQYFLAFKFGWFPILLSTEKVQQWTMTWPKFHSMILPILAMSFGSIAGIARTMRAELAETLNSEFMLLAKTKGLTQRQATLRHALRNSFLPLTGTLVGVVTGLLSGSLVIERIFSIPGIGQITVQALSSTDYPVAIATMLVFVSIGLVATLIVDLLYGVIDPRIRMGGRKVAI